MPGLDLAHPDEAVRCLLSRYDGPAVDLSWVLCRAHESSPAPAAVIESADGATEASYAELSARSARLAGGLRSAGVRPGDAVGVMLPKSRELLVTLLAIWRLGAVHVPLFTALGTDAVSHRLSAAHCVAVVVDAEHRSRVGRPAPGLLVVSAGPGKPGDLDFAATGRSAAPAEPVPRSGTDPLIIMFTSGTTGKPKGVVIPVRALASFHAYMLFGLGLRPDDVYLNISDHGWGYGLFYGIIGALLCGHTTILRDRRFEPRDLAAAVERHRVTNLCGPPTAFRGLRAAGVARRLRENCRLRRLSSAGEPLTAELGDWAVTELGLPIHDHYGQSELGMVIGYPHGPADPASIDTAAMGPSLPGFRAVVVDEDGTEAADGTDGELAVDTAGSPLFWFTHYLDDQASTAERFRHGPRYYLTADRTARQPDGVFRSATRSDDVITTSGYRIGPFDIETAVASDRGVTEVAAIGVPDPHRVEAIAAVVVLAEGRLPGQEVSDRLSDLVRNRVGKHATLRHVIYVDGIPKTPSGKIQRSALRRSWVTDGLGGAVDIPPSPRG